MLCYNGQFKDYNGLYAIATDLIFKKKEIAVKTLSTVNHRDRQKWGLNVNKR